MSLIAVVLPIVPGKTAEWRKWLEELSGPRHAEFAASRRRAGVRERTFLQPTPMGDLVIVTLEGDDPARSFAQMMGATDEFSRWFVGRAEEFHGISPASLTELPSSLIVDSDRAAVAAM